MLSTSRPDPDRLLQAARDGAAEDLGALLQMHRNYLSLLAASQLDGRLQVRCSPSDVVQETFLEAHRDFPHFKGSTTAEFQAWLREILVNNLLRSVERHVTARRRCVRRETSLEELGARLNHSTARLEAVLADREHSASAALQRAEWGVILADELAEMPDDYRQVLRLRHLQGLSFKETAERMNRSSGATRMLWVRAISVLRERLAQRGVL